MRRMLPALAVLLVLFPALGRAQTLEPVDVDKLRQKPISTVAGPVGDLLRQWWKDGTASGNVGDYYDNRDGDHSPLNLAPFPQLLAIKYSSDDLKLRKNWAAQHTIHRAVVFGNSSTSAPPTRGGSNPRHYYCASRGLSFLAEEYAKNNLYIYPEHRDHDPGHNGKGDGFGDLYPTNTPYLLISQGSSGSDQPFMRAVPLTLAAFRPDVKKKLIDTGTLMPTLQMIFRSTNKHLKGPDEYLTGKAHPSVFEGSWIDELAMVKLAHALELKALPPIVRLKVIEDAKAIPGVDYFEDGGSEYLSDTPAVIARIHRSKEQKRRLVISASGSYDLNKMPLTYRWVVLRGDPERIQIKPRGQDGSVAEVTVAYHERRPIAPGSPMESNRVDIGVFVSNGTYWSAPGFVTFFTLDSEGRTYDATGRIVEIGHGMGEADLRVTDWSRVLKVLAKNASVGKLFGLNEERRSLFEALALKHEQQAAALREAQVQVKDAEAREKKASGAEKESLRKLSEGARTRVADVQKALTAVLDEPQKTLGASPRFFFQDACRTLARAPDFLTIHRAWWEGSGLEGPSVKQPHASFLKELSSLGLTDRKSTPGSYGRSQLEQLHLALLGDYAFPGMVQVSYQLNFVDQRLTAPKSWRDVYHYAAAECTGWTRYYRDRVADEFNHEGLLVVAKDDLGRCKKACTVRYTRTAAKGFPDPNPLRMEPGDQVLTYEFAGPDDRRGKRVESNRVK
jgi:hypothetical protein